MEITLGSLFSGLGGIDLAFAQAGCRVLWAVEWDSACCKTYRHNFHDTRVFESDIRHVDPIRLQRIDILSAGFPCQSFSVAGKQQGFLDPRGHMFYEVGRFIAALSPRFVFLENVPNLMEHDNGKSFLVVHNVLSDLNYSIRYRVLRASEYGGLPQIRDRIYIIAFREQEDCDRFCFPERIPLDKTIGSIIHREIKQKDLYYYKKEDPFYAKAVQIVNRKDSVYRVYHDSIKITQNKMCPTLTASMGTQRNQIPLIKDDYGIRKLTVRECLDFQGFPDSYYFPRTISINDAYKQIGNTVCVPVVKRIAAQIIHLL